MDKSQKSLKEAEGGYRGKYGKNWSHIITE